jgi:aminoglycoside phosphotransferase (APT) family kinase protein
MDAAVTSTRATAGVDLDRVTAWLAEHVPALKAPLRLTRIGGGQSNLTYRIDDDAGASAVLRRPPLGDILESAHDMGREHGVQAGLGTLDMPVPRMFALCQDRAVTGAPFYVMDHVDGAILITITAARGLDERARHAAGLSLAQTLARLQSVDLDAAGLADMRRPKPYLARQLKRWRGQWEASRTRELPLVDELADRFEAAMPAETDSVLVHGDYRLDNVVLSPGGEVLAVLDWELCTVGHPLADVGLMLAYWEEAGTTEGLFPEPVTAVEGMPSRDAIAAEYAAASGRDVGDLPYFVAFAYWKVAVIVEGVYRRWLNDPANGSESAGGVGAAVERLAALADVSARDAGI